MFIKNLQRKIRSLNVILETTKVMGDDLTCWEEPKLTCSIPYPKSVTDGGLRVECIKKFKEQRVTRKENLKWKSILGGFNFLHLLLFWELHLIPVNFWFLLSEAYRVSKKTTLWIWFATFSIFMEQYFGKNNNSDSTRCLNL